MEYLLTYMWLQENKQRAIGDLSKETVDDRAVLEQTKTQAINKYNRCWAFACVPCWRDAHKIVETVAAVEGHTPDTDEQLLHDKVAEGDEEVINQRAPPDADRIESEKSRLRVRI